MSIIGFSLFAAVLGACMRVLGVDGLLGGSLRHQRAPLRLADARLGPAGGDGRSRGAVSALLPLLRRDAGRALRPGGQQRH